MDAGRADHIVMGVRELKLQQELSIAMILYNESTGFSSPWFTSPDFASEGLLVRCCFISPKVEAKENHAEPIPAKKQIQIQLAWSCDKAMLNKTTGKDFREDFQDFYVHCVKGTVSLRLAVPGTTFQYTTSCNYSITNDHLSTPRKANFSHLSASVRSIVKKWGKEDKQLVFTIEVALAVPAAPSFFSSRIAAHNCGTDTLQAMLTERLLADVRLQLQGGELQAHRAVLAACSPVFRAMFEHDMSESQSGQVDLRDVPLALMDAALRYMYGGELMASRDPDLWMQVLQLADRFQLAPLKVQCEATLCARVSELPSELLLRLLVLADQHNAPDLRSATLSRFATCMRGKELGSDALDLVKNYPSLAKDLMQYLLK